jgi:hypothetical protein
MPWLSGSYSFPPHPRWPSGLTTAGIGDAAIVAIWRRNGQRTTGWRLG